MIATLRSALLSADHVTGHPKASPEKTRLHPRSRHRSAYDFLALARACPELDRFIRPNPVGNPTIDFADPAAVIALNRALLKDQYGIAHWDIPSGYLCPPIPSRADYLHHLADLLATGTAEIPHGPKVAVLDVGVGANCIYPILGASEYGWRFVGTDVDLMALAWARKLVAANPTLAGKVELRQQPSARHVFKGIVEPGETFAASLCNPPFHASRAEAAAGTLRKLKNLHGRRPAQPTLNFGGQSHELWCEGGEAALVRQMIRESAERPDLCRWFTTLVSRRENLPPIYRQLKQVNAAEVRTINLHHGQKKTRIVAWRY